MNSRGIVACFVLLLAATTAAGQTEEPSQQTFDSVEVAVCLQIQDRLPVDRGESFPPDVGQVYLWCKVTGAADTTVIKHVWVHEGEEKAAVELPIRSSWWRTWSSKKILPTWTGQWEVRVLDADGNILKSTGFMIEPQASAPEAPPHEEPPDSAGAGQ